MRIKIWIVVFSFLLIGCSTGKEAIMPFKNMLYNGSRILPIKNNETDFSLRIWINNSTSIERIITVSSDSLTGNNCNIIELGILYKNNLFKEKKINYYSKSEVIPESGFKEFRNRVNDLNLIDMKDQVNELEISLHQPISIYIVEVKESGIYNSFKFRTYFPDTTLTNSKFDEIQNFLFDEFNYEFKM